MQRKEILSHNVNELKEQLSQLNLAISGRMQALQDRLLDHYNVSADEIADEESDYGYATSMHNPRSKSNSSSVVNLHCATLRTHFLSLMDRASRLFTAGSRSLKIMP